MQATKSELSSAVPNALRLVDESFLVEIGVVKSVHTARTWRAQGRGPKFIKVGSRVKYRLVDLERFLNSRPSGGGRV